MTENYQVRKGDMVFDLKKFNKFGDHKSSSIQYILDDGTKVIANYWDTGGYSSEITKPGSPYTVSKIYYPNLKLKAIWVKFDGAPVGNSYAYDENGKLSKQFNHDEGYLFSITDLTTLFKKKYGIDLTKREKDSHIDKANEGQKPAYSVTFYPSSEYSIDVKIDGTTGQILKEIKINQTDL